MLRTRLWMGALLIGLVVLLLLEDRWFAPWYPILFVCYLGATVLATRELLGLLPADVRPNDSLTLGFVALTAVLNWWPALPATTRSPVGLDVWHLVGACLVVGTVATFLREMWHFRGPDRITVRIALTVFTLVYLGVLPSFLAQIRWLPGIDTAAALALTVFVTKGNDIGAYFTGKFLAGGVLGRHQMTPLLSPKKTWEGAVGGMILSIAVALLINAYWSAIPGGLPGAIAFGFTVGLAGVLGDLAESLLKRDLQTKDASTAIPGFGGVLDVVDSLLFSAPVAYVWFWVASRHVN
jgi:phosphatidate cytidylyltransferase